MKKDLIYIPTSGMSHDQWLEYRLTGLGASEIGCVMGLDAYKTPAELFNEKIGREVRPTIENMAMFHGKELESYVADLWQYWEGDEASVIRNKSAGRKVRRMRKINAYVRNPEYPWLFVSLDRVINKTSARGEGALEVKTTSNYNTKKWEGEINPAHIIQNQTQIGVCEFDFGEIATLIDGRNFDVYPFDKLSNVFDSIVETSFDFWERVIKGRKLVGAHYEATSNFDIRSAEQIQVEIDRLEPPASSSDTYLDFLSAKYKNDNPDKVIQGNDELLNIALDHKSIQAKIASLTNDKNLAESHIKNYMKDAVEVNFGTHGKVTWRSNIRGSRVFNNLIK